MPPTMILNLTGKIAPIACGLLCCCSMVYAQGNDTSEVMLLDTGWEFSQSGTENVDASHSSWYGSSGPDQS